MNTLAGMPYFEAVFDKKGKLQAHPSIGDDISELFVMSHGWRNDRADAEALYREFFTNFSQSPQCQQFLQAGGKPGILAVFWPSRNFDILIATEDAAHAGGAAAIGGNAPDEESVQAVIRQLEALKGEDGFSEPGEIAKIDEAIGHVRFLGSKKTSREAFIDALRGLMAPEAVDENEDSSQSFMTMEAGEILDNLTISSEDVEDSIPCQGEEMAMALGLGNTDPKGQAAGVSGIFKGITGGASNAVSYLSYYLMKQRAGLIGSKGLAPLLDKLAEKDTLRKIHIIGHSFGGRVVTAAAKTSRNKKLHSMSLLQAAFSHNGFSPKEQMNGFFRSVVAESRITGPIIITHTKNDKAVGLSYPLASRLSRSVNCALGDENDKYGAIGRNGAQKMNPGEVLAIATPQPWQFSPGKINNLLADAFIANHGDVCNPVVAGAVAAAALG